jgi:hypothetical protein
MKKNRKVFQQAPAKKAIPAQTLDPAQDQVQYQKSAKVQMLYQIKVAVIKATAQANHE